jgi:hypothetical protein
MEVYQNRQIRREKAIVENQAKLSRQQDYLTAWLKEMLQLTERLKDFVAENVANLAPISAILWVDAGFGTKENIAEAAEMGYEIYSKPHGTWLSKWFSDHAQERTDWQRVGSNAEMLSWKQVQLDDFPYPVDLAYERFWVDDKPTYRHAGQIHFGTDAVTSDLPGWFHYYNARQIIEAANKESKQVFEVHHLKIRAQPALQLQEQFALFTANFVRFASVWLAEQCPQIPEGWKDSSQPDVKQQVKIGAHASAWVCWMGQDCLLRFDDATVFAGRSLQVKRSWAFQPALPFKSSLFSLF